MLGPKGLFLCHTVLCSNVCIGLIHINRFMNFHLNSVVVEVKLHIFGSICLNYRNTCAERLHFESKRTIFLVQDEHIIMENVDPF